MKFEWDEKKATANVIKHGIEFDYATRVFFDPARMTLPDIRQNYGELRENTVGLVEDTVMLAVTHTDRNGVTRLISARRANKKERKQYHGQNH